MAGKPWNVVGWLIAGCLLFGLCVGLGSCLLCSRVAMESVEEFDRITASQPAAPTSGRSGGPPNGRR
jgi:hypothetical protein